MAVSPAQLQHYLKNITYPASKQDLVSKARENGAGEDIIGRLQKLPEQQYSGPTDVSEAFGRSA
ncbi:MAG: DUF2795 domain-containing protein [Dehalococcoidia bacterium]|nr:DUF2795 domain-containing protein [Dehalococcoidia bacterium]